MKSTVAACNVSGCYPAVVEKTVLPFSRLFVCFFHRFSIASGRCGPVVTQTNQDLLNDERAKEHRTLVSFLFGMQSHGLFVKQNEFALKQNKSE